jgi:GNAT superfamily N-acetyltransferase
MLTIRPALEADLPLVLRLIRDLARYEKLEHKVVADEETLRRSLFGPRVYAEAVIAEESDREVGEGVKPVGFALFFHNFSTFIGRPGIYLEDLYVEPEARGRGYGKALLAHLAKLAKERNCGRVEWAVLDWNEPSIKFYESIGARMLDDWRIFRLADEALAELADSPES